MSKKNLEYFKIRASIINDFIKHIIDNPEEKLQSVYITLGEKYHLCPQAISGIVSRFNLILFRNSIIKLHKLDKCKQKIRKKKKKEI